MENLFKKSRESAIRKRNPEGVKEINCGKETNYTTWWLDDGCYVVDLSFHVRALSCSFNLILYGTLWDVPLGLDP
jgi:hypothetical protein